MKGQDGTQAEGLPADFGRLREEFRRVDDAGLRALVEENLRRAESEWRRIQPVIDRASDDANGADATLGAARRSAHDPFDAHLRRSAPAAAPASGDGARATSCEQATKTLIPGYPVLDADRPSVGEFVAFVADMRNSSARFSESATFPNIRCGLQRIFYETSALIPAIAHTAAQAGGQATELLGDGLLILFHIERGKREQVIARACAAATRCIDSSIACVNELLWQRHRLPPLKIGIGLAYGPAIVKVVDANGRHPKVIGQCIWDATKLSGGENAIGLSRPLQDFLRTKGINEHFEVTHA
ncbi:hypothetical protein QZM22_08650 [Burkholderia oklahomensis]|uniref:hypothetical protein n=1 Tax=Burkholderia oklahomensis TaxID=342113 RepID=UPI002650CB16|nr:hypothetical protein [Burkholderia oklahomensis]MDN7672581.1 hypothetical protein [Burkholderia oklahomensis]